MNYANIKFDFGGGSGSHIRVGFTQGDGHWSRVGNTMLNIGPDDPTMNLDINDRTSEEEFARIILHEFGHALGMIHEHQSPAGGIPWDEPKVYKYYRDQYKWEPKMVYDNVLFRYTEDQANSSEFDPDSIMMYEVPGYLTKNGLTIVGQNCKLSEKDKSFIANLYPGVTRMQTTISQRTTGPISSGKKHIITNVKYKNAAFLEGDLRDKTLKATHEQNIAAEVGCLLRIAYSL
jgi:serralysin